ncbi:hypothetical protein SESBI_19850 [Sesbania bispinosa]|nr:hypothetical protein SESBI_19850 [Sesbania bispinosa]
MDDEWGENDVSTTQAEGDFFGNEEDEQPSSGDEKEVSDSEVSSGNELSNEATNVEDEQCGGGIVVTSINNVADFANVEWKKLNHENFLKHGFANRELAFKFYNWYHIISLI